MQKLKTAAVWALAFYMGSLMAAGFVCGFMMALREEVNAAKLMNPESYISSESYAMVVEGSLGLAAVGGFLGWIGVLPAFTKKA